MCLGALVFGMGVLAHVRVFSEQGGALNLTCISHIIRDPTPSTSMALVFHQCLSVLSLEGFGALHIGLTSALSRLGASGSPPRRWLSSSGAGVGLFVPFSSFCLVKGSQVGFT